MNKTTHPIEPEELMAYLDGELPAERAASAAAHVAECAECSALVEGFQAVSHAVREWKIENPESVMSQPVADALEATRTRPAPVTKRWSLHRLAWPRLSPAWVGGAAVFIGVLAIGVSYVSRNGSVVFDAVESRPRGSSPDQHVEGIRGMTSPTESHGLSAASARNADTDETSHFSPEAAKAAKREIAGAGGGGDRDKLSLGPMIIRTADLQLITKDFDKSRADMEAILKKHRGYVSDLKVGGATGSGRTLTSTLRVPTDQLDPTLTELKTLGRVESESQGGEDMTSKYVDLQARLANSRTTEKRLTDILNQRTGKLSDVLEVEQEVDRVRGEIEEMEAESKQMTKQVSFATLNVTITEDYKAQLEMVPPSTATRLSNAAVEGYRSMVDGIVGVALFALTNGPSLLLWAAVLFLPARFAWKAMRRKMAQ